MNTTKNLIKAILLATLLTTLVVSTAFAAPPDGKRRSPGVYHHNLGNGRCEQKLWWPYGPPVKNKEWKKGPCSCTPSPTPVPTTPPGPGPSPTPPGPVPSQTPVPVSYGENDLAKLVKVKSRYARSFSGEMEIVFAGDLRYVRACHAGTTTCVFMSAPPRESWRYTYIGGKAFFKAKLHIGLQLEPGRYVFFGHGGAYGNTGNAPTLKVRVTK